MHQDATWYGDNSERIALELEHGTNRQTDGQQLRLLLPTGGRA